MKSNLEKYEARVSRMIITLRSRKVILDRDLAALYSVATFRLNEAI